jgi:hypothetical protein
MRRKAPLAGGFADPAGWTWTYDEDNARGYPVADYEHPEWLDEVFSEGEAGTGRVVRFRVMVAKLQLPANPKGVARVLLDHCRDAQMVCWPGMETIAGEAGLHRTSAQRAVRCLEQHGLVLVARARDPRTQLRVGNRYFLAWPKRAIPCWRDVRESLGAPSRSRGNAGAMSLSAQSHGAERTDPRSAPHGSHGAESDSKGLGVNGLGVKGLERTVDPVHEAQSDMDSQENANHLHHARDEVVGNERSGGRAVRGIAS